MGDLAISAVLFIIRYLHGEFVGSGASDSAAVQLYNLINRQLVGDNSIRLLTREADAGDPRERTVNRAQLAVEDAMENDPSFANKLSELIRLTGVAEAQSPGGSVNQRIGDVRIDGGGRHRIGNTNIALGGSALLAIALVFVWFQYSSHKGANDEIEAYQVAVVAACDRIRQTGTGEIPAHANDSGITFRRDEIVQLLARNHEVIHEQVGGLLSRSAPEDLAEQRAAVDAAIKAVDVSYPDAAVRVKKLPRTLTFDDLQDFVGNSKSMTLTSDYRRLGDALTRLAGSACTIEVPAATN